MKPQAHELRARLDRYRAFLAADPSNVRLAGDIAEYQMQLGDLRGARDTLRAALAHAPQHPSLLGTLASVAMADGQPDEAIALLQDMLHSGQDSPPVRYNLSYALVYAARFAEARDLLTPIVDDPQLPGARLLLARCLHNLGELDEAIRRIDEFVAVQPAHSEALGLLALLHLDAEHPDAAQAAALTALQLDADDLGARLTLGSLALGTQDGQIAHQHFARATERHPQSGRAWSGLGLSTLLQSDLAAAAAHLKTALKYMPDHIGTWHALAWCQVLTEDLVGAGKSFESSLELNRNFSETHGGLGVVAALQERAMDAEEHIKRALRLDRESFSGRFAQSLLLGRTDPSKAQALVQQILATQMGTGRDTLGAIVRRTLDKHSKHKAGISTQAKRG